MSETACLPLRAAPAQPYRRGGPRNPITFRDDGVAEIELHGDHVTLVDAQDVPCLMTYRWHRVAPRGGSRPRAYAMADAARGTVLMHRLIAGAGPTERVHHADGNGLNNRRANLRIRPIARFYDHLHGRNDDHLSLPGSWPPPPRGEAEDLLDTDVVIDSRLVAEAPDPSCQPIFGPTWQQEVHDAVAQLAPRHRAVVERRFGFYGHRETLEAVGRELGLTRERVRQVEAAAVRRLAFLLAPLRQGWAG